MYLWAKILLTAIILSVIGGILFAVSDYLPDFSSDSSTEEVAKKENDTSGSSKSDSSSSNNRTTTKPSVTSHASLTKAKILVDKEDLVEARDLLWKMIKDEKLTDRDDLFWKAGDLLGKINTRIIFSKINCPEKAKHKIRSGDNLSDLSKRYFTTTTTIKKGNNLISNNIRIGQTFLIYNGNWSIKAIKSKFKLILFDGDKVFKIYNIATGKKATPTPTGTFEIVAKEENPIWRGYKAHEPQNVLGTRWMKIEDTNPESALSGYGIHGTKQPSSIRTQASLGCLRMHNRDVEELYDILPKYTPCRGRFVEVTIVE